MLKFLNAILGSRQKEIVSSIDKDAAKVMEDIYTYYSRFNEKLELFRKIKEVIIQVKAKIYDFEAKEYKSINKAELKEMQNLVDQTLNALIKELAKIKKIISTQSSLESEEIKYTHYLLDFVEQEISKEQEYKINPQWSKYKELLLKIKKFLLNETNNSYGLFHVLACQLNLLRDIEIAQQEIEQEMKNVKQEDQQAQERLIKSLRILEVEVMRLGKYCAEEAEIVKIPALELRQFKTDYNNLRNVGLVYSEKQLTPYNLGLITTKLSGLGKNLYGVKGVGILHEDNVEFRFVKGAAERHAEVVQVLFAGMPGAKLADEAVIAYLYALPLERITKIAGYELQLELDENGQLKIININYASTIVEVQIERKTNALSGEFLVISKRDFERLNYGLLFSINKELLDKKAFEMTIGKKGNKIVVLDKRIYPFVG